MTARNKPALERSQAAREAIFQAWGELVLEFAYHWPAVPRPPTARELRRRLPAEHRTLSDRAITWHMSQIAMEAQLACGQRNSSTAEPALG